MRVIFLVLVLLAAQEDYSSLMARLRVDDPGAWAKVLTLDRETALQFLRERYGAAHARSLPPDKAPELVGARHDRYEVRATLHVGAATIDVADEGLGRVELDGVPLRSPLGLRRFGDVRYVSRNGAVVKWDRATTVFEPVDESFGGARFQGFRETWTVRAEDPFESVEARGSWEIGASTDGILVHDGYRGWAAPPMFRRFGAEAYATPEKLRTGTHNSAGFTFQASGQGALVQFAGLRSADGRFVGAVLEQAKAAGDPRLDHRWSFIFEPGAEITLPSLWTIRVTGPEDAESLWSAALDFLQSKVAEEVGFQRPIP